MRKGLSCKHVNWLLACAGLFCFLHICNVCQMSTLVECDDHAVGVRLIHMLCYQKRHPSAMSGALGGFSRQIFHFYSLNVCKVKLYHQVVARHFWPFRKKKYFSLAESLAAMLPRD